MWQGGMPIIVSAQVHPRGSLASTAVKRRSSRTSVSGRDGRVRSLYPERSVLAQPTRSATYRFLAHRSRLSLPLIGGCPPEARTRPSPSRPSRRTALCHSCKGKPRSALDRRNFILKPKTGGIASMMPVSPAMTPADQLAALPTPALLLDERRMLANISRLRERAASLSASLRPHLKTAKSVDVARRLLTGGTGPATALVTNPRRSLGSCT